MYELYLFMVRIHQPIKISRLFMWSHLVISDYITPVMHIDPSGESFLVIGGAILLGGLIGGFIGVVSRSDDETVFGSFIGGFINGAVNTTGLAAALATGGTGAFLWAAGSGLVGGGLGSFVSQYISSGHVKLGLVVASSLYSATSNLLALYGAKYFADIYGVTWGEKFVSAIIPSLGSFVITSTIAFVVLPNPNRFLYVQNTSLFNQTKSALKIDFSWR
jgi:hypothetical protein